MKTKLTIQKCLVLLALLLGVFSPLVVHMLQKQAEVNRPVAVAVNWNAGACGLRVTDPAQPASSTGEVKLP